KGIERYREQGRERFLDAAELARLGVAIREGSGHGEIITAWGSLAQFASDIAAPYERAREMAQRAVIERAYWPAATAAAGRAGVGLTIERLEETAGIPYAVDESKPTAKHAPRPENRRVVIGPHAAAALRLLLLTGARLREILTLRWDAVDAE